jgi:hypothetical protein
LVAAAELEVDDFFVDEEEALDEVVCVDLLLDPGPIIKGCLEEDAVAEELLAAALLLVLVALPSWSLGFDNVWVDFLRLMLIEVEATCLADADDDEGAAAAARAKAVARTVEKYDNERILADD